MLISVISYGPRGREVIMKYLDKVFYGDIVAKGRSILPLSPLDFYFEVIIPQAAFLLIAEDSKETDEEVIVKIIRDSEDYGTEMFPALED